MLKLFHMKVFNTSLWFYLRKLLHHDKNGDYNCVLLKWVNTMNLSYAKSFHGNS